MGHVAEAIHYRTRWTDICVMSRYKVIVRRKKKIPPGAQRLRWILI